MLESNNRIKSLLDEFDSFSKQEIVASGDYDSMEDVAEELRNLLFTIEVDEAAINLTEDLQTRLDIATRALSSLEGKINELKVSKILDGCDMTINTHNEEIKTREKMKQEEDELPKLTVRQIAERQREIEEMMKNLTSHTSEEITGDTKHRLEETLISLTQLAVHHMLDQYDFIFDKDDEEERDPRDLSVLKERKSKVLKMISDLRNLVSDEIGDEIKERVEETLITLSIKITAIDMRIYSIEYKASSQDHKKRSIPYKYYDKECKLFCDEFDFSKFKNAELSEIKSIANKRYRIKELIDGGRVKDKDLLARTKNYMDYFSMISKIFHYLEAAKSVDLKSYIEYGESYMKEIIKNTDLDDIEGQINKLTILSEHLKTRIIFKSVIQDTSEYLNLQGQDTDSMVSKIREELSQHLEQGLDIFSDPPALYFPNEDEALSLYSKGKNQTRLLYTISKVFDEIDKAYEIQNTNIAKESETELIKIIKEINLDNIEQKSLELNGLNINIQSRNKPALSRLNNELKLFCDTIDYSQFVSTDQTKTKRLANNSYKKAIDFIQKVRVKSDDPDYKQQLNHLERYIQFLSVISTTTENVSMCKQEGLEIDEDAYCQMQEIIKDTSHSNLDGNVNKLEAINEKLVANMQAARGKKLRGDFQGKTKEASATPTKETPATTPPSKSGG